MEKRQDSKGKSQKIKLDAQMTRLKRIMEISLCKLNEFQNLFR